MSKNWTEKNLENFLSRVTFDFITQLEKRMETLPLTQAELAEKLNITAGRVSQILNGSSNLELKSIIKYARALGLKVAVVAYNDGDPDNTRGLINSEIFSTCWERQGAPVDFFALEETNNSSVNVTGFINNASTVQLKSRRKTRRHSNPEQGTLFLDKFSPIFQGGNKLPQANVEREALKNYTPVSEHKAQTFFGRQALGSQIVGQKITEKAA